MVVQQLRAEPSRAVTASRHARPWAALLAVAFVGFMIVGNLALLGTSVALQVVGPDGTSPPGVTGIDHARIVDDKIWRGGAQARIDAALAAAGRSQGPR